VQVFALAIQQLGGIALSTLLFALLGVNALAIAHAGVQMYSISRSKPKARSTPSMQQNMLPFHQQEGTI
jgi:hypothetical protein